LNALPAPTLLALLLTAASLHAGAETVPRVDTITWLSGEPSPAADSISSRSNAALSDRLVPYMLAHWPQVRHQIVQANPRRAWQMLSNGEQVCQSSSVRTAEREKLAYFTNTLMGPPLQLIVRRDRLATLPRNAAGEVELARLLADERLRGALVDGRSYGGFIDGLLDRRPAGGKSLALYASADFGSKILPMLGMGRADYTIGYDVALSQARVVDARLGDLLTQPIAGASEPMLAGVACPRTPWGLAAIRGIDKVLGTPAGAAMLRESAERWLTPEARQLYSARMDAFYKERAKPSLIR